MFSLFNEISELVYVADMETYELLFINTAGKEFFKIDDVTGLKCYKALQGLDEPCPFCTNALLSHDTTYTWEFSNPYVSRHYLLKDKLTKWGDKDVRLEIAVDVSKTENEKMKLKNSLEAQKTIMECVQLLYQASNIDFAINSILERIGNYLLAERVYIFEIANKKMSNLYEWCKYGIKPEIENLQDLDIVLLKRWKTFFAKHECVIIENIEDIKDISPLEYKILNAQGITSLVAAPLEKNGKLTGYIGVDNPPTEKINNISSLLHTLRYFLMSTLRRTEDEELLKELSLSDKLTGFSNRNCYMNDIDSFSEKNGPFGIAYLDINGLKDINDHKGHSYGDKVLEKCAEAISQVFYNADFYRIGGDEFVIICKSIEKKEFQETILELKKKFEFGDPCYIAIGYKWTNKASEIKSEISTADAMMYEDKKQYYRGNLESNRYRHYNDDVLGLTTPGMLQKRIKEGRFVVYFQPKVLCNNRTLSGAEALIRYKMPDETILAPDQFLPLLEELKLISQIDFYVFEYTCSKVSKWLKMNKKIVPISVNFSRHSLLEKDFVEKLNAICNKYNVNKKWLEIEMTESVKGMEGFDIVDLIGQIQKSGYLVSIDDFGVHYANLSLFTAINFDVLKIDKSLIDSIATNEKSKMAVEFLIDMCKKMKIQTIAEGVETESQFEILAKMGCTSIQGYLFNKPLPSHEYEKQYIKNR